MCFKNGEKFWSSRWYKISLWSTEIQMTFFFFADYFFYPNQTFLCINFSQFSLRGFDNGLKRVFLNFLLFTIHNYYFTTITNTVFFKQLASGPRPQICLYLQYFQGSKLLKSCSVLWPNNHILSVFRWFFRIRHWHTIYH